MSLENEDRRLPDESSETFQALPKKPNLSYSRDFLLSLSNLDICKKLPDGFDKSLLSEFEDVTQSVVDRPRIHGSLPLQGFKRNEYGSSPPTRVDPGSYSKFGKWESRSSSRSDRDSDSQSDKDSDSGRRFSTQARRSWQNAEHDGLLGSGSSARPSGFPVGNSAPKSQYQLSKSNEPYHPPRPFKALTHSRRDTDSLNDETFGSSESTTGDKAEEEMRRRAEFEMMRKEQQKVLQEKLKLKGTQKAGGVLDVCEEVEDSKEENRLFKDKELGASAVTSISSDYLEKTSLAPNSPAIRPLVPPGFTTNAVEKTSSWKSVAHPALLEVGESEAGGSLVDTHLSHVRSGAIDSLERKLSQEISLVDNQPLEKPHGAFLLKKKEDGNFYPSGTQSDPKILEHSSELLEEKIVGNSNQSFSSSILGNIFGSTSSVNRTKNSSDEHRGGKPDDTWSASSVQSSKFVQWFSEEEPRVPDSIPLQNDLMSLIAGGDKTKYQVSIADAVEQFPLDLSYNKNTLEMPSHIAAFNPVSSLNNKEEAMPSVLTCEDLEQSILSEYNATIIEQPPLKLSSNAGADTELPRQQSSGSNASLHLLSLLQKGSDQTKMTPNASVEINIADKPENHHNGLLAVNEPERKDKNDKSTSSGSTLTLETLFGSAFMQELQSAEAPVSVQKGPNESYGIPFQFSESDISDNTGFQGPNHTSNALASDYRHKTEHWGPYEDSHTGMTSQHRTGSLPKQQNLIPTGDPRQMHTFGNNSRSNMNFSTSPPIDIMQKLASLGGVKGDQVSENPAFRHHSPYEEMGPEIPFRNFQAQQSPQLQPKNMGQSGPSYHQLRPQMNFLGPEPIFNHDLHSNRQFSSMTARPPFHHTGYDDPSHHSMLHQMKNPGIHPPHMKQNFHHGNQSSGSVQEMNQMPFWANSPSMGSPGVRIPGPNNVNPGSTPPEAFQRLIQMELRANSKQNPAVYGHEVRHGFQLR